MVKTTNRLTAREVERLRKTGLYPDGHGLAVQITKTGTKSWVFRYMLKGKARVMGLGACADVTLAEARAARDEARKLLAADPPVDPIEARRAKLAEAHLEKARTVTFREAALDYVETRRSGWKSAKHAEQWKSTFEQYAFPTMGNLPVSKIDTAIVLKVLRAIWNTKPETASRLRGRIENVLDAAAVLRQRDGSTNPARWRGMLDKILPKPRQVRKVKHHPALPYAEIPEFMAKLRAVEDSIAALALRFTILTAARTNETIGATWPEIKWAERLWIVPAERMKAPNEHRVPLTDDALAILRDMQQLGLPHIFPGQKRSKGLSNNAMLALLERMKYGHITVHGFRSTFRDWTSERTNYGGEVAEMALAHTIDDETEAAYRRGDLLDKRRRLMDAWAAYCAQPPASEGEKVVPIRSA